jgi:hypothetical protein
MTLTRSLTSLGAALLAGLALLTSCAPKPAAPSLDVQAAKAVWESFLAQGPTAQAFELSGSMNLTTPQKSARVLLRFRGDLEGTLRLDMASGTGTTFAMWREGPDGWLAVYPMANQAFSHPDTRAALGRLGLPLPFNLRDLAALLTGRYAWVLPPIYKTVKVIPGGYEYAMPAGSRLASVTLDFAGNPVHLAGKGVQPWSVELSDFSPPEQYGRPLAQKMNLTTPGGTTALLRVKKLELLPERLPEQSLDLPLPPTVKLVPLDKSGEVRTPDLP